MNTADKDILTALEALPSSTLLDVMDGMGNINTQMRGVYSMTPGQKMVGRAVTMRVRSEPARSSGRGDRQRR